MSITITIKGNMDYCDKNCPEKIIPPDVECQCMLGHDHADPECHWCGGTGVDRIMADAPGTYPYEMNVANSNFKLLWNSLGLDADGDTNNALNAMVLDEKSVCGEIRPHVLHEAIKRFNPSLMVREDRSMESHFEFGMDMERIMSYISRLTQIVEEAMRREELVVWH